MLNSNRQTVRPEASPNRELEAIVEWLRGLSAEELDEFRQALASHNAERLVRFHTNFRAWSKRSG